jgi:hypothetical protein
VRRNVNEKGLKYLDKNIKKILIVLKHKGMGSTGPTISSTPNNKLLSKNSITIKLWQTGLF